MRGLASPHPILGAALFEPLRDSSCAVSAFRVKSIGILFSWELLQELLQYSLLFGSIVDTCTFVSPEARGPFLDLLGDDF